jgi:hypothetical protein
MYLDFKWKVKGDPKYKISSYNHHKNETCHVQYLEKDFYFGAPNSFDHVFTLLSCVEWELCNRYELIKTT